MDNNKTHFGNKIIDQEQKASMVSNLFSSVASNYDIMNDVMSMGIHRMWKKQMVNEIPKSKNIKILDLASGTADIMIRYIKSFDSQSDVPTIFLTDLNFDMLSIGRDKVIDAGITKELNFVVANGEALPFPDNSFDVVTISFGIRNFTNIAKALQEIYRVLKPMGKFICLEFSTPPHNIISWAYDKYSYNVIPCMGQIISNDKESYQYLVESIRKFPKQEEFANMMRAAGLSKVSYQNLTFGICAIHTGWKV